MVFGSLNTGSIAGVFTGIQVGAAVFISQLLIQDVGLGLLGFWRYAIALLVLLPLLLLDRRPAVASSDWLTVSLLGVGQIGVMITLLNVAVFYTSAGRGDFGVTIEISSYSTPTDCIQHVVAADISKTKVCCIDH